VLKLPVPIHHQRDTHRYVGTADMCITKDPDADWYNFGAYRCEVYDGKTIGCQITEGKHGRIHRDKYFERGQSCKFAIVCGQDPLLYMLPPARCRAEFPSMILPAASAANQWKLSKVRSPVSDPCRRRDRDRRRGRARTEQPEGPFGEWMGYYSDDVVPRPY
jgi:4-hydroxy-3-polyprenylbenzoate decarboxylase